MPSLSIYKKNLSLNGNTNGQIRKNQSDMIMEQTWWEDIQSRVAYLYDYYHDDEVDIVTDLHPENSSTKIPVEIKFIQSEYNSLSKDQVSYHIQFKPSYVCNVDYYEEMFGRYNSIFPIGLYIDLPDEKGIYRRWLIVDNYSFYANQFPTFQVLPTDYKLQWIYNNKKYESWAVLRSQSSYNSGVWMD